MQAHAEEPLVAAVSSAGNVDALPSEQVCIAHVFAHGVNFFGIIGVAVQAHADEPFGDSDPLATNVAWFKKLGKSSIIRMFILQESLWSRFGSCCLPYLGRPLTAPLCVHVRR